MHGLLCWIRIQAEQHLLYNPQYVEYEAVYYR